MSAIHQLFQEVCKHKPSDSIEFPVLSLPKNRNHKLGVTKEGNPRFFVKIEDEETGWQSSKTVLENLEILFGVKCDVSENGRKESGLYVIVTFIGESDLLSPYFLEIMSLTLCRLEDPASMKGVKAELVRLTNLFTAFKQPPKKTIQGLWAELLLIEQAKLPSKLLPFWHFTPNDKFDFNDGFDKIEVKSTSDISVRKHTFSVEQLYPFEKGKIIICSVVCLQTSYGVSIKDLIDRIADRLDRPEDKIRLNEIVATTLGETFKKAFEVFYDYETASSTVKFSHRLMFPKLLWIASL